ncbi:MAG TPA: PQQ-dependent sugar dehydrogenase [Planctomycetota bacterium]|nr:PQQ-dependent sugar dehydrogenase [Planctomycetota bacterium]
MSRGGRLTVLLVLLALCTAGSFLVWHLELLDRWMLRNVPVLELDVKPIEWTWRVETVCEGLDRPTSIAALPGGRLLITERAGRLRVVDVDGTLAPEPLAGVPAVRADADDQGGLLDVALHPNFAANNRLYLSWTADTAGGETLRVASFRLTDNGVTDMQLVFAGLPGVAKGRRFGGQIAFGRDGKLYLAVGDCGTPSRAQDPGDLAGKTLRLNDDGSVPDDNPFAGRTDARGEIFSLGHREVEGIAVQPETGLVWETEQGPWWTEPPAGGDEINVVEAGRNYGWPVVRGDAAREGMESPRVECTPTVAPAGCAFGTGRLFRRWEGDFFFTTLVGRSLVRLCVSGRTVLDSETLLEQDFGRLRDVTEGADGYLYVITGDTDADGPGRAAGDRLLRILPTPVDEARPVTPEAADAKPQSVLDFTVTDIDGAVVPLATYRGKVLLIVNVASRCGFTPQYAGLEKLYETYRDRGLVVLGFPANNFLGQEPGTDAEIKTFCTSRYNVTFPMFSKVSVKGDDIHPLYAFLTSRTTGGAFAGQITWNFNKYLVGRDGRVVARFGSTVTPESAELVEAIERALAAEIPDDAEKADEAPDAKPLPDEPTAETDTKPPAPEEPAKE